MKSNAKPSRCPWSLFSAVLLTLAAFSVPMHGQEAANTVGYSEDWSSHHVVFSNPGTEADAVQSGHYGEWLKITSEPRYQMQQAKRNAAVVQPTLVAPASNRLNFGRSGSGQLSPIENGGIRRIGGRPVAGPEFGKGRLGVTIDKDWSMSIGTAPSASLTITVSNAPGSGTVSGSSTFTVDGQTFTGSVPTNATQTGTFTGNPTTGQTVTVGADSFLASDSTPGSQTGTFFAAPTISSGNITLVNGANTFNASTTATQSQVIGTFTAPFLAATTATVTSTNISGGTTTTFSSAGTGTAVIGVEPANLDTIVVGSVTYNWRTTCTAVATCMIRSGTFATDATELANAINGTCQGTACTANAAATGLAIGATVYVVNRSTSATAALTRTGTAVTVSGTIAIASTTACSGTTGTFAPSNGTITSTTILATNLAAAINACPSTDGIAATSAATVTVKNTTPGATSTFAFSAGGANQTGLFSWGTVSTGSNGSLACNGITGTYLTANTVAGLATNFQTMLNFCSAANAATIGINNAAGQITTSSGAVMVPAGKWGSAPGVTLSPTAAGYFQWGGSTFAGGTDGTTDATHFTVDNVLADNAAALALAITDSYSGSTVTSAHTTGSASLSVTAALPTQPGTGGSSIVTTTGTITGFSWGGTTLVGSDGTTSSTRFKYWTTNTYDTEAELAADLTAALNANATVTGALTVTPNSNQVTLTANTGGSAGNSFAASDSAFSALTGTGSFTGGVDSTVNPNTYPAKYSFSTTTASCSDLVIYPTGFGGPQATIVGYNSLYKTTCGSPTSLPNVAFAYNTPDISSNPGTAGLSPIFSLDGSQIAYVESVGTAATLVLLKPSATSGGTVALPASITYESLSNYRNCVAPCYTTIAFSGGANDTNSSPYYDYNTAGGDILWVGDDAGKLHEFTGVFNGTSPAENLSNWPVTVDSGTKLSSPVWDSISGNVFVTDSVGKLSKVTTPGTPVVTNSAAIPAGGAPLNDAPILDEMPASPLLYVTMGDCCNGTAHTDVGVERFTEALTADGYDYVTGGGGSTTLTTYAGSFDNIHYDIAGGAGGFFVVCLPNGGTPGLYHLPLASGWSTSGTTVTVSDTIGTAATCSPVTEFLGAKANTTLSAAMTNAQTTVSVGSTAGMAVGDYIQIDSEIMHIVTPLANPLNVTRAQQGTAAVAHNTVGDAVQDIQDWAYLSVSAGGGDAGCLGACLYNYNITTTTAPTNATTGIATTGGASAVIVDNALTTTGESQIYFSSQGNEACAGNGTTGDSTGATCAVQASQPALQ